MLTRLQIAQVETFIFIECTCNLFKTNWNVWILKHRKREKRLKKNMTFYSDNKFVHLNNTPVLFKPYTRHHHHHLAAIRQQINITHLIYILHIFLMCMINNDMS